MLLSSQHLYLLNKGISTAVPILTNGKHSACAVGIQRNSCCKVVGKILNTISYWLLLDGNI